MSRRGIFGIMLGGTAAYWFAVRGGMPLAAVDRGRNVALLKTKGGNLVAATQDDAGRVFMFDRAGNIYYDTEDPRLGVYVVDAQGEMINEFVDAEGRVIKVPVGNIADLRTVTVEEIGGVPVRELQRSIRDLRGGRLTGFVQPADPGSAADLMPPNAPSVPNWEGNRVGPPPFLEDLEVELQPKSGGGLFGGSAPDARDDPVGTLRSLRRGDK